MAWLKITFDPTQEGEALCTNFPRRGHHRCKGRWVVFDKDDGYKWSGGPPCTVLLSAEQIEECHTYIRENHEGAKRRERLLNQLTVEG